MDVDVQSERIELLRRVGALEAQCADMHEQQEEMRAAWIFEVRELRTHIDRQEARAQATERALLAELVELTPLAECGARAAVEAEEREQNGVRRIEELRRLFLGRPIGERHFGHAGRGLYDLWQRVRHDSCAPPLPLVLASETHITKMFFNVAGAAGQWRGSDDMLAVPPDDVNDFFGSTICQLPTLRYLAVMGLPSLATHCLPWVARLHSTLRELWVPRSSFAAVDLIEVAHCCPWLEELGVTACECVDWSPYAELEEDDRQEKVDAECGGIVYWW